MQGRLGQGGAGQQWGGSGGGFGSFNPMMMMGGLGSLGAGLGSMFGGGSSPADAGMEYLDQISGKTGKYFDPYINAGNWAMPQMKDQYGRLINDPGGKLNEIGQGFQQSPGFKFALQNALSGAGHASAAGGMAGSPMHEQQNMGLATNLANQDYYNWLNQATGMYGKGLQGMEGFMNRGLQAGTSQADMIAQQLAQQANMAYAGQNAQNQQQGSMWGNILGGLGGIAGAYLGGPMGASVGSQVPAYILKAAGVG